MPSGSAGRRYAQAIFELAQEGNKLQQWSDDLIAISQTFSQPQVQTFLENPKTPRENKVEFVGNVLGNQVGPEALKLAQMLVQRHRHAYAESILQAYTNLWNRLRGIEVAHVTTAIPVGPQEENQIRSRLAALTGKQVTLDLKVDPDIIGGMIAQVGDTLLDGSIRTRLQNLRKQLA
ncbi:MAG: synthase delta subunit [Chloroflexi bacterium]|jgi:F-type H+-transporting ATPase subunit delta|nr:synthase delta subunit [Chloroflexota bacterium]